MLGKFELTDITIAPRGVPQIEVTFEIDVNSILQVTARDKTNDITKTVTINYKRGLSETEIERLVEEAKELAEEDKLRKDTISARYSFESECIILIRRAN